MSTANEVIGLPEQKELPREMTSEAKQCDMHKVEVKLDFSYVSKAAAPPSEEAMVVVERALQGSISRLPWLSFAFMAYSAMTALYESKGECGTVFFVVGSFTLLGLLFLCMKEFEKTKGVACRKGTLLKIAVWILSVLLTVLFTYRVTVIVDSPILNVFVYTVAVTLLGLLLEVTNPMAALCVVSVALTMVLTSNAPAAFVLLWFVSFLSVLLKFIYWAASSY